MRDDFAVFILTHGRPDNIRTYKTLVNQGYTGKMFFILDNEDETICKYIENYGKDRVIIFDKAEIAKKVDTPDLSEDKRTIVYARNACFDIAKKLNIRYFLQLDDDYSFVHHRFEKDGQLSSNFCDVNKPFSFVGRINEDVNTYTLLGNQGNLILSVADANIVQLPTQSNKGGMTDVYLDKGTYLKSFYSVIYSPQCVKVARMGRKYMRLHHQVSWNNCTPMILSEKYKSS